jgi:hypothetical protein
VTEKHAAKALYSPVNSLIQGIRTAGKHGQQDAAHHSVQIGKLWTILIWSESNLTNGKPPICIPKEKANLVDLK